MGLRFFICSMLILSATVKAQSLEDYRKNYISSKSDKSLCEAMINYLHKEEKTPLYQAYLGAYQAMWANHVFSPISKLSTFNKGKKNIQAAVSKDTENIEIRILRYSVQNNAPGFLGFNKELKQDKIFIKNKKNDISNPYLIQLISDL